MFIYKPIRIFRLQDGVKFNREDSFILPPIKQIER